MPLDQWGSLSMYSVLTSSYDRALLCLRDESSTVKCLVSLGTCFHMVPTQGYQPGSHIRPERSKVESAALTARDVRGTFERT